MNEDNYNNRVGVVVIRGLYLWVPQQRTEIKNAVPQSETGTWRKSKFDVLEYLPGQEVLRIIRISPGYQRFNSILCFEIFFCFGLYRYICLNSQVAISSSYKKPRLHERIVTKRVGPSRPHSSLVGYLNRCSTTNFLSSTRMQSYPLLFFRPSSSFQYTILCLTDVSGTGIEIFVENIRTYEGSR